MTTTADERADAEPDGAPDATVEAARPSEVALPSWAARLVRAPLALAALCVIVGLAARLDGLDLAYTSDEGYWLQRTVRFADALADGDFSATYRSGHPGVTVMWTGLLGIGPGRLRAIAGEPSGSVTSLERASSALGLMTGARTAVTIVAAGLFGVAAVLAGRLLGPGGLLGGLLLCVEPYVVGMTRLLHVDALLTPLLLVSGLAGLIYWLQGRRWPYLALSAVAGGLALLTKAPALALIPFFGIAWLVLARPWRGGRGAWAAALAWAVIVAAVYVALWPVMWVRPALTVLEVARFALTLGGAPHLWPTYFLGGPTAGDPGLLFYPVAIALRLGPVAAIGLLVLAGLAAARRLGPAAGVLWLLVFVVVFVDVMAIGSKKFDRYALPAVAVLTILGGVGVWAQARLLARRLAVALIALAVVAQAVWLASAYPYPIAAYNPLLGGTAVAQRALMVGWGEGLDQAAGYLHGLPDAGRLTASTQYHHVLRLLFRGRTERVPSNRVVDYYVVYVNMIQRDTVPTPVKQAMATATPAFTATVNGVPYAWVYRGPFQISSQRDVPADVEEDESEGPTD
jgi:4-amino-4-deoxy-L-arabinose transferase-like glycosyltransferase